MSGRPATGVPLDLWCISLGASASVDDLALLSNDERTRATRFVHERDRERYVSAHAALRRVLARYAGCPAPALRFVPGPQGRPTLDGELGFHFNLSHSGALALIGVSPSGPLGVDIEELRPVVDGTAMAERYFSPAEAAALWALPPERRDQGFLTCWTRKEACLKALGAGLTMPTRDLEVGIEKSPRDVELRYGEQTIELTVTSCDVHRDAVAALATTGPAETRLFKRRSTEIR